jgi:acyl-CoA synthetase (AMP-forming)/AMP-acid ligase II
MSGVRCGHAFRDYEDVRTRAGTVANGLAALAVTAGDRVAIYLHNQIEFIEASIGIGMLGCCSGASELALERGRARLLAR